MRCVCARAHLFVCVCACVHVCAPMCSCVLVRAHLPACVLTYLPACVRACHPQGWEQAVACGRHIRQMIEADGEEDWKTYFYVSPYTRTLQVGLPLHQDAAGRSPPTPGRCR